MHPYRALAILAPEGRTFWIIREQPGGQTEDERMRYLLMVGALASVAACGGGGPRGATGEISQACIAADRRAASPALCSCVQQVANQSLSSAERTRAATFFTNPQLAQDTRQSDRWRDEQFWDRYRAFTDLASTVCQPTG